MTPGERLDAAHVCVKPAAPMPTTERLGSALSGRVGGDIPDGGTLKDHELNEPPEKALSQRDPGEACGDAGWRRGSPWRR